MDTTTALGALARCRKEVKALETQGSPFSVEVRPFEVYDRLISLAESRGIEVELLTPGECQFLGGCAIAQLGVIRVNPHPMPSEKAAILAHELIHMVRLGTCRRGNKSPAQAWNNVREVLGAKFLETQFRYEIQPVYTESQLLEEARTWRGAALLVRLVTQQGGAHVQIFNRKTNTPETLEVQQVKLQAALENLDIQITEAEGHLAKLEAQREANMELFLNEGGTLLDAKLEEDLIAATSKLAVLSSTYNTAAKAKHAAAKASKAMAHERATREYGELVARRQTLTDSVLSLRDEIKVLEAQAVAEGLNLIPTFPPKLAPAQTAFYGTAKRLLAMAAMPGTALDIRRTRQACVEIAQLGAAHRKGAGRAVDWPNGEPEATVTVTADGPYSVELETQNCKVKGHSQSALIDATLAEIRTAHDELPHTQQYL